MGELALFCGKMSCCVNCYTEKVSYRLGKVYPHLQSQLLGRWVGIKACGQPEQKVSKTPSQQISLVLSQLLGFGLRLLLGKNRRLYLKNNYNKKGLGTWLKW
jgi:hypothetical protein